MCILTNAPVKESGSSPAWSHPPSVCSVVASSLSVFTYLNKGGSVVQSRVAVQYRGGIYMCVYVCVCVQCMHVCINIQVTYSIISISPCSGQPGLPHVL